MKNSLVYGNKLLHFYHQKIWLLVLIGDPNERYHVKEKKIKTESKTGDKSLLSNFKGIQIQKISGVFVLNLRSYSALECSGPNLRNGEEKVAEQNNTKSN